MTYTLDASAMLALVRREQGWDVVRDLLAERDSFCMAHAINLCEVFYDFYRGGGEPAAQAVIQDLSRGIVIREDLDSAFWQEAGRLKADRRRVSLADCFCITLARRVGGEVVTADHHEFDAIVPLGLCPVRFIR